MKFALLTLFTSLSLATVSGWFSIIGFMSIYAGAPIAAIVMGSTTEFARLVTISWVYRNWVYADWKLKLPLLYFSMALMLANSIGVFGYLSKAHIEQGSDTINNSSKIEILDYQIQREKNIIVDNEKIITQLDATVNSFLGKDRIDKSLSVRKSQASQRKQLRDDISLAQKKIDELTSEKFKLESEVRKLQLDVGPIRYIAELFYGVTDNTSKNIESAVRIFTLLLVSTLDPLAVVLLIAANHSLLRIRNEKEENSEINSVTQPLNRPARPSSAGDKESNNCNEITEESSQRIFNSCDTSVQEEIPTPVYEKDIEFLDKAEEPIKVETKQVNIEDIRKAINNFSTIENNSCMPILRSPTPTRVTKMEESIPELKDNESKQQDNILRELIGNKPHFIPKKLYEDEKKTPIAYYSAPDDKTKDEEVLSTRMQVSSDKDEMNQENDETERINAKYSDTLSWINEFKRT